MRAPSSAPLPEWRGEITGPELRRDLYDFADDSMHGRATGTEDVSRAARFLAARLQRLGLEPGGDSLYVQRVPLQRESILGSSRISVEEAGRSTSFRIGTEIVPLINLGARVPPAKQNADGDIVFVGYGLSRAGDPGGFGGVALEGKVVVVVNGAPRGADSARRETLEAEAAISDRLSRILPHRPAAVVILLEGKGQGLFEQLAPQVTHGVGARSGTGEIPDSDRPIPMILLGVLRPGSPFLPVGWPTNDRAQPLGRRLSAHIVQERTPITAFNVVAVIRGSDPTLSRTFIALGAHYDHIGIVPPVNGDSIANGADDDGSGSVSLLAIARSIQQSAVKPKRSMLFVWHVGEEDGLLGSSHFVEHPTVPIDSIVAQINADMIGRNAPSVLYVVGPQAAPNGQSRRLGVIADSVNAAQPTPFIFNREWDSSTHPEHIYERSDHYNYARKGVPIVFFTTGDHADYHKPSDEPSKIEYEKMARVARLIRDVAIVIGNSAKRPR
ncbi:MAG: M28 family peptidase [Gemmatimonadota bacterium]